MKEYTTNSPKETKKLATEIASQFKGVRVIGLVGELGAGKTVFVQGLAEAMGITEVVNSPTFVLMKNYEVHEPESTVHNLVHVDAYRLNDSQELNDIGLEEYLNKKNTIVVIEWADKVKDLLPVDSVMIEFKEETENKRVIQVKKA